MSLLIDKYYPEFTFYEQHSQIVNSSAEKAYDMVFKTDYAESKLIFFLCRLRGIPVSDLTINSVLKNLGFKILEEIKPYEFVAGCNDIPISIGWNFTFTALSENKTKISTETRVFCKTRKSKFTFSLYWLFLRPFSGLIRKEMLRLLRIKLD